MVPPEEIEKAQPATLPADFSEWDNGDVPAKQPAKPAAARVAVLSEADPQPNAASRTSAAAYAEAEQVFQPRLFQGVDEGGKKDRGESKGKHKMMVPIAVLCSIAILLIIVSLGYSRSRSTTVMPKQSVALRSATTGAPQTTTTGTPQTTPTNAPAAAATQPDRLRAQSEMMNHQLSAPSRISNDLKMLAGKEPPPSSGFTGAGMDGLGGSGGAASNVFSGQNGPKVKVEAPKRMSISAGVAGGLLVQKTSPTYPQIAKGAHVSGTVVIQATISKTGLIENLRVVSGPTMLRQSALDAVRTWRYRPYLLDGEPVEVETTVSVAFTLGG